MLPRLLAALVAQSVGMGILHAVLVGRGERKAFVAFCGSSAALAAILGLAAIGPALFGQSRMSAWTIAWIPAFALGFLAAGAVLGAAWLALVRGGDAWIRARAARRHR